jgi:hypothetical protein
MFTHRSNFQSAPTHAINNFVVASARSVKPTNNGNKRHGPHKFSGCVTVAIAVKAKYAALWDTKQQTAAFVEFKITFISDALQHLDPFI